MRCAQWQDKVSAECVPTLYCYVKRLFVARPGAWVGSWGRARLGLPARPRRAAGTMAWRVHLWLSQIDKLSSKQTPDARKTRFSLFGFNLTQARAADDELWCVYDPVFDLFLPCEPAA